MVKRWILACVFALLAVPASAGTYYVSLSTNSPAGNNANAGTIGAPWRDLSYAVAHLSAGDTLYIRGGLYTGTENRIDAQDYTVPSGNSTGFVAWVASGWPGAITISGYTGETVTIRPPDGKECIRYDATMVSYVLVKDLVCDMSNQTGYGGAGVSAITTHAGSHHDRFINVEVKNNTYVGVGFSENNGGSHHMEWFGGKIHDLGDSSGAHPNNGYAFYISSNDHLVDGVEVYNACGYGVHNYTGGPALAFNNTYRNGYFHNNGCGGSTNFPIIIANGDGNTAYNNLIVNNTGTGGTGGIRVYTGTTNTGIYHNTIYGNSGNGIELQYYTSGVTVRNNLVYSNGGTICDYQFGGTCSSGSATIDHNLTSNPSFVNAGAGDFTLQSSSAAIDAGATIGSVTVDKAGTSRPQGSAPDDGAYEYASGAPSPDTFYVAPASATPAGSDSNTGSITSPWLTVSHGVAALGPSDTLYIRGGTYTGTTNRIDSVDYTVASGTNFSSGAIVISAYPGETVTLQPPDGKSCARFSGVSYVVVYRLHCDMANGTTNALSSGAPGVLITAASHHVWLSEVEVKNNSASGIVVHGSAGQFSEFHDVSSHDNGKPTSTADAGYGFDIGTSDNVIDRPAVYANAGAGILIYNGGGNTSRNRVTNGHIYGNGTGGGTGYGILYAHGSDGLIANNYIFENRGGVLAYTSTDNLRIYNNTIVGNTPLEGVALQYYSGPPVVRNTITYGNAGGTIVNYGGAFGVTPVTDHNLENVSPNFTNAAIDDYSLSTGASAARDAGVTLADVPTDIDGDMRPQGAAFDIGADESIGGGAGSEDPAVDPRIFLPQRLRLRIGNYGT